MKIAIIGAGYVGAALLELLKDKLNLIGYDINKNRVKLLSKKNLSVTTKFKDIKNCSVYIITLPTPVNNLNKPDLKILKDFTIKISKFIKKGDIVIYESTYAPYTTNEIFKPLLEKNSKLKENKDFFIGYSPERINPGTSLIKMKKVTKLVSSNNRKITKIIASIYSKGFKNIYECSSIEVAEASKIIENIQRDLNIAFFNELSQLFTKIKINPSDVFKSASTKWNFINMLPGLVGGHCLPVDPYYFTDFLKKRKLKSDFLISGRKINEVYVEFLIKRLESYIKKRKKIKSILFLGCAYKDNVSDFRTSKSIKIIDHFIKLKKFKIIVYDPNLEKNGPIYKNRITSINQFDIIIQLVNHDFFIKIKSNKKINLTDINSVYNLI